jgi:hypothetical protein
VPFWVAKAALDGTASFRVLTRMHLKKKRRDDIMKLNTKAVSAATALLWGGAILTVGVINLIRPRYGKEFLQLMSSVYPGYRGRRRIGDVAVGTGYALLDGAVGGAVYASLYNCLVSCFQCKCHAPVEEQAAEGPQKSAV